MLKTGIFGGSFDPVHTAHLILAELAAEASGLDEVLLVPAGVPPHKRYENLAGATHRLAMLRAAAEDNPRLKVSDIELKRNGPSYTYDTVKELEKKIGDQAQLNLILGADSLLDIHNWYRANELIDTIHITGLRRPGFCENDFTEHLKHLGAKRTEKLKKSFVQVPRIDISATEVRRRVKEGKTIKYLVPENVRRYIIEKELYR